MCLMRVLIILSMFFTLTISILLQLTQQAEKKCFTADLSSDKTLQAKFGIIRTNKEECSVRFTVSINDHDSKIIQNIHDREYNCHQARSNDPYVIKHTCDQYHNEGKYQLCVQILDIRAPSILLQLFMGQRLNPHMYHNQLGHLPLVESNQLLQVEEKVQTIKRALIRLQQEAQLSSNQGQVFDRGVDEIMHANRMILILHIGLLIVFGFFWAYLVKQLKRNK